MYIEDRTTYQCYASYRTIGNAVNMSPNTVRKYVTELVERGLI
ncbi:MAG: helix-turn-helix domain-containing protein [Oscillospiraceae bacterium]